MKKAHASDSSTNAGGSIPPLSCTLPDGYLDIPFTNDRPRILRFEAGLVLDPQLRKLARLSGAVDRSLALRLARLRAGNRFMRLGYGVFRAYASERLNLPPRTASEFVRLGKALLRLPLLDAALRQGRLTWTSAAQVARLVGQLASGTGDDAVTDERDAGEAEWVALAERLSVRDLTAAVARELERRRASDPVGAAAAVPDAHPATSTESDGAAPAPEPDGAASAPEPDLAATALEPGGAASAPETGDGATAPDTDGASDDDEEDDPLVRLRVVIGGKAAALWTASLELCEIVVGRTLAPGEGEEYIVAEFLSGTSPVPEGHHPCGPCGAPVLRRLERPRRPLDPAPAEGPTPAGELGPRELSIELSAEIAQALMLVDAPLTDDPFALDASMRQLLASRAGIDLDLARLLRNFQSLDLARHLGFRSFAHYVNDRLGISVARARFLVTLDRSLTGFPEIADAVRQGHIGVVAALQISRVVQPGASVRAWIRRARKRTLARLREEVRWAQRRIERLDWRFDRMPPPTGPLPSDLSDLTAQLSPRAAEVTQQLQSHEPWIRVTGDPELDADDDDEGDDADDADVDNAGRERAAGSGVSSSADSPVGTTDAEQQARDEARRFETSAVGPDSGPPVRVEFLLRESAVASWTEARQRIGAACGLEMVSDRRVLYEMAVAFLGTYLPVWIEQVECGDPVAVRDRFRCQLPGCPLHRGAGHHLRFRSRGGGDELWNLLFVCDPQHLEGIHALGSIRVTGRAPNLLVAELGIRPDGTALETFIRRPSRGVADPGVPATAAGR